MKCTGEHDDWREGGHDWVLVAWHHGLLAQSGAGGELLWACPCGEFRWTSYADWEQAAIIQRAKDALAAVEELEP